jgi:hypothetical protein
MSANNTGEQVRKALFRVAGTVVGIGVGLLLVNVIGDNTALSLTVILVARPACHDGREGSEHGEVEYALTKPEGAARAAG